MRIQVSDPRAARSLVRFLRSQGYLAVAHPGEIVEAVPITGESELAERTRTLHDLDAWRAQNPDMDAKPVGRED